MNDNNENENDSIKLDETVLEEEADNENNDENTPNQTPAELPEEDETQLSKQMVAYAKVSKILQEICETRGFDFHSSYKGTNYLDMKVLNVVSKCNDENKPLTKNETDDLLIAASHFLSELTVCQYTGEYAYEIPISGTYHVNKMHYFLFLFIIEFWKCRSLIRILFIWIVLQCLFYLVRFLLSKYI